MEPRNRFQGMNSASLCSLAGRYENPIPTTTKFQLRISNFGSATLLKDSKVEGTTILIRTQINCKTLGAVLDTEKSVETLVWLFLHSVPDDETVDPGCEEVVD
jgi:hypothetical protein